jgi:TetR/AcrR family transcriptional repressor of nem operon
MSSREKILSSAAEMIHRNGYIATSVDQIVADAGVSKSNFYYHFKSKEDLGLEFLQQRKEQLEATAAITLLHPDLDPGQRIDAFMNAVVSHGEDIVKHCGCPFGNLAAEISEHSEKLRCAVSEVFTSLRASITAVLEDGQASGVFRSDIPACKMACVISQTIQGMLLMAKCQRSPEPLQAVATLRELITAP